MNTKVWVKSLDLKRNLLSVFNQHLTPGYKWIVDCSNGMTGSHFTVNK